jgi:hypothetical protein
MAGVCLLGCYPSDGSSAYPGYTFYASGATAYLVDMNGKSLHTWKASGSAQTCAYLLADGSALFPLNNSSCTSPSHDGAYPSGRFQKISWDGAVLWDYYFCDSTARAGYDVEPMPNGNILVPADSSTLSKVFEIQPTGTNTGQVVWQYTLPTNMTASSTYLNSVSYNPALDQILVDLQEPQRKLVVIDHSSKSNGVIFTNTVATSGRVHAAVWVTKYFLGTSNVLPDSDFSAMRTNNLLVVYNGGTKALEVSMATSNTVKSWTFAYTDHEGSVQRLPNGNTLLSSGNTTTITEMDDSGNTVATITAAGSIDRAYRYGYAFPGVYRLVTNKLIVASSHGSPSPSGTTTNAYGAYVTATVNPADTTANSVQYTNAGWQLSSGKATNGASSGASTNVVLLMTNHFSLTWLWKTNYWLQYATNGSGSVTCTSGASGWNASASVAALTATAPAGTYFVGWSGDTNTCTISGAQLSIPMTQARTITGNFAALPTNLTLQVQAANASDSAFSIGVSNLPAGASGVWLTATSLVAGGWQTSAPFVFPGSYSNWSFPRSSTNTFFRLRLQ